MAFGEGEGPVVDPKGTPKDKVEIKPGSGGEHVDASNLQVGKLPKSGDPNIANQYVNGDLTLTADNRTFGASAEAHRAHLTHAFGGPMDMSTEAVARRQEELTHLTDLTTMAQNATNIGDLRAVIAKATAFDKKLPIMQTALAEAHRRLTEFQTQV